MKELAGWLEREARREEKTVSLEQAFLEDRIAPYAYLRLRYFLARAVLAVAIQAIVTVLLFHAFARPDFHAAVLALVGCGLAGSFWWGALESMRARVRLLYRAGRPHRIPREIGGWLRLSLWPALFTLAAAAVWIAVRLGGRRPFGPADLFIATLLIRLAVEFPTRAYHSGVYAIRRIYRPFPAMVAVDLAGLAALIALWPWLGTWGWAAATLLSMAAVTFLSWRYTTQSYRFLGMAPLAEIRGNRRRLPLSTAREMLAAGAASVAMSLDSLLVLALFLGEAHRQSARFLFVLFFALAPAVRAGFEWAQLFYFDLKRFEVPPFGNLRAWIEDRLLRLAWLLGLCTWGLACAASASFARWDLPWLEALLLPFFVTRSLLAAAQVRAFSARAYGRAASSAIICLAGYAAAGLLLPGQGQLLLALSAAHALAFLAAEARGPSVLARRGELLPPAEWLHRAACAAGAARVSAARCWNGPWSESPEKMAAGAWFHRALAQAFSKRLRGRGHATVLGPGRIVWYEEVRSAGAEAVNGSWAVGRGGGLLEDIGSTDLEPSGREALRSAALLGLLGDDLSRPARPPASAEDVEREFRRRFPAGIVLSLAGKSASGPALAAGIAPLDRRERRLAIREAAAYARELRPSSRRLRHEVTAYCEAGELRSIFLCERAAPALLRRRWRRRLRQLHVAAALSGPRTAGQPAAAPRAGARLATAPRAGARLATASASAGAPWSGVVRGRLLLRAIPAAGLAAAALCLPASWGLPGGWGMTAGWDPTASRAGPAVAGLAPSGRWEGTSRRLREIHPHLVFPAGLGELEFARSPFLVRHRRFEAVPYSALGIVLERRGDPDAPELGGEGSSILVKVLAGEAAAPDAGGRPAGPGSVAPYASSGGDAGIWGNPRVGDIVRWYPFDRYACGWVGYLEPNDRAGAAAAAHTAASKGLEESW